MFTLPLALLPLPDVTLLVGVSTLVVLALVDPVWGLYATVLSVPVQELVLLPGGISYTQAALLITACSWVVRVLAYPEKPLRTGRIFPALVLFVWALLLSTSATPYSQVEGFKEVYRWSTVVLVYLVALNTLEQYPGAYLNRKERKEHKGRTAEHCHCNRNTSLEYGAIPNTEVTLNGKGQPAVHSLWKIVGLVVCLLFATSADALIGLWQFWTGDGPPSFRIPGSAFVRAYGTIGKPNSFAGYINMGWPLAGALAIGAGWQVVRTLIDYARATVPHTPNARFLHIVRTLFGLCVCAPMRETKRFLYLDITVFMAGLVALLLAALFASFSRGGWVGAVGGTACMLLAWGVSLSGTHRMRFWQVGGVVVSVIIIGIMLASSGMLPGAVALRVESIARNLRVFDVRTVDVTAENFSVVERMAHMQAAWMMVDQHPLVGVGPGNYTHAYEGTQTVDKESFAIHPWYTSRGHAHNYYLHIAAEAGLCGLIAYLVLLYMVARQAYITLRHVRHHWLQHAIAIGCCGIIGAVAVHNLFENLHVLNMGIQLGAVWGLLGAVSYLGGMR